MWAFRRPYLDQAQERRPWTGHGGSYVATGFKTDVRMLPQCGPLESPVADKLGVVYETDRRAMPGSNSAEGREPEMSVWLRYARRSWQQG